MTAGLYVRVSTLNQVDKDSLSTQESRLRAYCEANEFRIGNLYKDAGISAKDTDRPELKRLMEDCRKGRLQAVVVTAIDRITRSLRDLIKLVDFFDETKVRFVSITQNIDSQSPFGRFMRDLLGLIARLERETVAARVATDMHHRASLGKWNGGMVPYGYTTYQRITKELKGKLAEEEIRKLTAERTPEPKKLYIDPAESKVVTKIFETFIQERSLRKTAHTLNTLGIKTRHNRTWAVATVYKILTSPVCLGKISYGKTKTDLETGILKNVTKEEWKVVKGQHEPIIPEDTFGEAQKILASNTRKPTRANHVYLLSGLMRCGKCGGSMYGCTFEKKSSGKAYSYYKCQDNHTRGTAVCTGLSIHTKVLDDFVMKTLTQLSKDTVFLQDKEKMLNTLKEELKPGKGQEELESLRREEKSLEAKIGNLMEGWASHLFTKEDFSKEYEKLQAHLKQNRLGQETLADTVDYSTSAYEALNASFEEISSFGKNWEFLDARSRAAKISTVVKQIKVFEDRLDMQVYLDVKEPSTGALPR